MAALGATLDELVAQALQLPPVEKVRLVERIVSSLERDVAPRGPTRLRSLYGALAHLGSAPSAEEIDEARREAWANFPRDDITP